MTDIEKIDAAKIAAELNQLRNQQFTLSLAAVTFIGISTGWILQKGLDRRDVFHLTTSTFAALAVLSYWLTTLGAMVLRLSCYLEIKYESVWETHINEFLTRDGARVSQTRTMLTIFGCLGLGQLVLAFRGLTSVPAEELPSFGFMCIAFVLFLVCLIYGALRNRTNERKRACEMWDGVLRKAPKTNVSSAPAGPSPAIG